MKERESYIDNIRVFLTMLVILHHAAVTYGAPGGWYYKEGSDGEIPKIFLTAFVAVNQSFFMGMFFLLSSYFIPASYENKGTAKFLMDRFKRLGIPIVFYSLVIAQLTIYLVVRIQYGQQISFIDFYMNRESLINLGVLWFTAALLLFTTIFVLIEKSSLKIKWPSTIPSDRTIILFALSLGIISFFVRTVFPIGWTLDPLGFQFAHFTQYIALFIIGIVAYRNQWLSQLSYERGVKWRRIASLSALIGLSLLYFLSVSYPGDESKFMGGFTVPSFANAVWEQFMGVALIVCLLGIGKTKWNAQSELMKQMSRSAYAVYIIHPLVLTFISLLLRDVEVSAFVKFIVSGSLAIGVSFLVAGILVRIPVVKEVV